MSCKVDNVCIYYTFTSGLDKSGFVGDCGASYLGDGNLCDTSWASCYHAEGGRTSTTYVDGYTQTELSELCAQFSP